MRRPWAVMAVSLLAVSLLAGCQGTKAGKDDSKTGAAKEKIMSDAPAQTASVQAEQRESSEENKDRTDLIVFAAASMTETLTQIAGMYKDVNPDVNIIYTFDSSGTLKTQIQEGADCDIFISAAQKQMDQLDSTADGAVNTEGLDFILPGTRFNLVENKVVLAVPDGNPAGIKTFEDLGTEKLKLICLGNEDVPVGAYSIEILTNLGILDKLEADSKITYGSNVKEVTTQVKEASVDCGIIYATDGFSAGLTIVDEAEEGQCRQVIYPTAILNISRNQEAARKFLDFLVTDDCKEVFEAVGFSMAP